MTMEINEEHGVNKAKTCLAGERISALQVDIGWVINMTWMKKMGY